MQMLASKTKKETNFMYETRYSLYLQKRGANDQK